MPFPAALRLALVPIGVAIAAKGLQYLTDEAERLDAELDARRAELAAVDPAAPEDFPPAPELEFGSAGESSAEQVPRRRSRLGVVVASAVGFAAGVVLATRAHQFLMERAAAELAAADAGYPPPITEEYGPCANCLRSLKVADAFPGFNCVDCYSAPTAADAQAIADARRPVDPEQVWDTYAEPAPGRENPTG